MLYVGIEEQVSLHPGSALYIYSSNLSAGEAGRTSRRMADDLEQQEVAEETQQTKLGAEQAKALNAVTDNVQAVLGCCCSMLAPDHNNSRTWGVHAGSREAAG